MADSFEAWINSIPRVTKYWFFGSLFCAAATSFGVFPGMQFALIYPLVFKKFQIWRLLTTFIFFGPFSFNYIMQMFILINFSKRLESEHYGPSARGIADFVYTLLFGIIMMLIIGYIFPSFMFFSSPLLIYVIYIWSRTSPHSPVQFWGFQFQAWHLPFVITVLTVLMGGSPILDIIGILIGHLFHFLKNIVPNVYHRTLLKTPDSFIRFFERQFGERPSTYHYPGTGHRLN